jgi:ribokinase
VSSSDQISVAVVGGYGVALIFGVRRAPGPGETVLADSIGVDHGGKGSNQAVAARRLGAEVALLTAVGPDAFGAMGRTLWHDEGVDARNVITGRLATMMGSIVVEAGGENQIVVGMGALSELTPSDADAFGAQIAAARVCAVSLEVPVAVAARALTLAKQAGTLALLNPAPAVALPDGVVRDVDVIVPNRSEAELMTGSAVGADADLLVDRLRQRTTAHIVLTLGAAGAMVDDGARRHHVPAVVAPTVVDTTGAGDSFTGALATGLARGLDVLSAVEFAVASASLSVRVASVIPSLPHLSDLPVPLQERVG